MQSVAAALERPCNDHGGSTQPMRVKGVKQSVTIHLPLFLRGGLSSYSNRTHLEWLGVKKL